MRRAKRALFSAFQCYNGSLVLRYSNSCQAVFPPTLLKLIDVLRCAPPVRGCSVSHTGQDLGKRAMSQLVEALARTHASWLPRGLDSVWGAAASRTGRGRGRGSRYTSGTTTVGASHGRCRWCGGPFWRCRQTIRTCPTERTPPRPRLRGLSILLHPLSVVLGSRLSVPDGRSLYAPVVAAARGFRLALRSAC